MNPLIPLGILFLFGAAAMLITVWWQQRPKVQPTPPGKTVGKLATTVKIDWKTITSNPVFIGVIVLLICGSLNLGLWVITSKSGLSFGRDISAMYMGLNLGLVILIGLVFLPINLFAKIGISAICLLGILLSIVISLGPNTEERQEGRIEAQLQPLELGGWRGSEIVEAPVKGSKPVDWGRTVITRPGQQYSFTGLDSDAFVVKNGKGKVYGSNDTWTTNGDLGERTFRFQATGKEPVKVLVTWETK